ncbi:MAG: hypothetical protein UU96_C0033G0006 [Parcubacteria group bacterium GW2011_GWC2_42_13]|nr:MAG: hypothetical protein UU96_C0033G0006 [Parcubacteria group bacterium GW2011_GWC2_42_13]
MKYLARPARDLVGYAIGDTTRRCFLDEVRTFFEQNPH